MADEDKLREYLRKSIADARETRRRLTELEESRREPIAIVGIGCRFPGGVRSADELWRLVAEGRDAVSGFPVDRGWDVADAGYHTEGGFIDGAGEFDAGFFGISPREALAMDPQQRIALEITWEALEHAGIPPLSLAGTDTGVFLGVITQEYAPRAQDAPEEVAGHVITGSTLSVASGRIAYQLGLIGPALSIDTACSSSLVSVHLACESLRRGESSLALAGGVTVMASPVTFVEFSRQDGSAADGRCKSFAASADGAGWAEGAGVLVLERLSDAVRNGRRILGVVRGSAVNQDGASNGLTAPNGPSQERVIRQALAVSGLSTSDIDVVEAHGTGTKLGDPIEAQALLSTYGRDRESPLLLGSVKSNLGHTQAAAGVAGVIKMVQAMRHGVVPRTLHVDEPTPVVDWTSGAIELASEERQWPEAGRPRRAGVSSFGISGTNAHLILEEPAVVSPAEAPPLDGVLPWVVTARTEEALHAQVSRLRRFVADRDPADIGFSLASTRSPLEHRAVVLGSGRAELLAGLRDVVGTTGTSRGAVAYVFSGQGSQRAGMGDGLAARFPVFASAFDEVRASFGAQWDLGRLDRTGFAQPALFAFEVALFRLLESFGARPDVLIGHSIGELAAAHVAGVLDLGDAVRVVTARARLMDELPGGGAMAALNVAEAEVPWRAGADLAAVNGPESVVVSGTADAVTAIAAEVAASGRRTRLLGVSHAFHSWLMEPMLDRFREVVNAVRWREPRVTMMSGAVATPEYWVRQVRDPVRFGDMVAGAAGMGVSRFVEVGPDAALAGLCRETVPDVVSVALSRRERDEATTFLHGLGELFVSGVEIDWTAAFPAGSRWVELPAYAFQHRHYWLDAVGAAAPRELMLPDSRGMLLTLRLSSRTHPWLRDHVVAEQILVPGAYFVDLAVRAGERLGCPAVAELVIEAALVLPAAGDVELQVVVGAEAAGKRDFTVHSRTVGQTWTRHVSGTVSAAGPDSPPAVTWPPDDASEIDVSRLYDDLDDAGYRYGPAFRAVTAAWRHGEDVYLDVELPARDGGDFVLHPVLLDAAQHVMALDVVSGGAPVLPFSWSSVAVHAAGAAAVLARVAPTGQPDVYRLDLADRTGTPVATVEALTVRSVIASTAPLYRLSWDALPVTAGPAAAPIEVGDLDEVPSPVPDIVLYRVHATGPIETARVVLGVVRRWLGESRFDGCRLVIVTHRALAAVPGEDPIGLNAAPVWGLVRSAQTEHPGRFVLLDVDEHASAAAIRAALATDEPQFAIRGDTVRVARLVTLTATAPPPIEPAGTVLITGGVLGGLVARHLVTRHGVRHIVMLSRRGTPPPVIDEPGVRIDAVACDVTDRDALASVIRSLPDLTGVVHTAGVVDDGPVASLSAERLTGVLKSKVEGSRHLHELTEDRPLSFFVLFSSLAGTAGPAGQSAYAAANAYLDAFAEHRRAAGLPASSMAWGLWAEQSGLTAELSEADIGRVNRAGVEALETDEALALFDAALGAPPAVTFPARLDPAFPLFRRPFARPRAAVADRRDLPALVRSRVAEALGCASRDVPMGQVFRELGFDSLAAIEVRNRLAADTGLRLSATVAFDHPTCAALAEHLRVRLGGVVARHQPKMATAPVNEPIAIVGIGCRYPGDVQSADDLWELVSDGRDAVTSFPADRGWLVDGGDFAAVGGFLHDAGEFDAGFFGISPREALAMDPQQRIALEIAWEALEHAGIPPLSLAGTDTGVFLGVMYHDYLSDVDNLPPELTGYLSSGGAGSVVSGRVAYHLGLTGPAVSIDTACSSSLVALHLAAQALRSGECDLALAGGVTVMSSPWTFVEFSRQGGLAADGRCKSFAAGADGTGWAEGAGVLVLERLSDAVRGGRRILGVVRGSAVNQDGASNGLTAPNGPSQERVIRQALAVSGLSTSDIDVVEAHGTGTKLGDPIEAQALLATYGQDRESPLLLGSIKSNLGHAQAAAGVAGVIKMVQAMRHGVVPRTLHVDEPTPVVDWTTGAIALAVEQTRWPDAGRPRRAGVSSFGASGTNAHVVLEQASQADLPTLAPVPLPIPFVLSARSAGALRRKAVQLETDGALPELAWSLVSTRSPLDHRAVIVADDRHDLDNGLAGLASAAPVLATEGALALVFSGQGGQWAGAGEGLAARFPVFASAFGEVRAGFGGQWDAGRLERTGFAQPLLFAFGVALFRLLESFGVRPDFVAGHSVGELAAAHVAGVVDLSDAVRVVTARARLMDALPDGGAMAALNIAETDVPWADGVDLAAVNGPESVVVAGEAGAVRKVVAAVTAMGRETRELPVSHAFHSRLMEPMLAEFAEVVRSVRWHEPRIPMVSGGVSTPDYWVTQVRDTVRFADMINRLTSAGVTRIAEIGPGASLTPHCREQAPDSVVAALSRRDRDEATVFLRGLGELFTAGVDVDWTAAFPAGMRWVDLPAYPFQRQHYWLESAAAGGDVSATGMEPVRHSILAAATSLPGDDSTVFTGVISRQAQPWLAGHTVGGRPIVPAALFVDLALRAGAEVGRPALAELVIEAPLRLPDHEPVRVQVVVAERDGWSVAVHTRAGDGVWTRHAVGKLAERDTAQAPGGSWPPENAVPLDLTDFYDTLAARGYEYRDAFHGVTAVWQTERGFCAEISLPEARHGDRFVLHPALVDAALHPLALLADGEVLVPFAWNGVSPHTSGATAARVSLTRLGPQAMRVELTDDQGLPIATVAALSVRPFVPEHESLFQLRWEELRVPEGESRPLVAIEVLDDAGAERTVVFDVPTCLEPEATTLVALSTVQRWLREPRFAGRRLVLRTQGAIAVHGGDDVPSLGQAPVWGLVRSAQAEHPGRFVLADGDVPAAALATDEPQLAARGGAVFVPKPGRATPALIPPGGDTPWHLSSGNSGRLDDLALAPWPDAAAPLEPGEIRIAVRAAGVNFRDVVTALGLIPGFHTLGNEVAGVVIETGAAVTALRPGARVMSMVADSYGPLVVTDQRHAIKIPGDWTFTQAAAVPMAFVTAYYALVDLAELKAGESILVHAAAGGVGMAAVQLARHLGADVFATASEGKHEVVAGMGVRRDHVASSRTLDFEHEFGRVDVVLNSLAREFVDASLRLLPPGGRFIEMGKTDLRDPADHPDVRYRSFSTDDVSPDRMQEIFAEIVRLFADGVLTHLPVRTWDVRQAVDAFRFVSQAKHIGKVVLTIPAAASGGTVLITGGAGTLGQAVARHLVLRHGMRHVVLTSRRGTAPGLVEELAELGAKVEVVSCDVADRSALSDVIAAIPRLTGVVHAAGTIDDGVIESLTAERVTGVLKAKVDGARHLDELTRDRELAYFVLFSSLAGTLGSAGQAGYAAANAYLDALARRRRAHGLPAVSMAWGLWAESSGITAGLDEADLARMARGGVRPLPTGEALELFDAALANGSPTLVPAGLDLAVLRGVDRPRPEPAVSLAVQLTAMSEKDRGAALTSVVLRHTAEVLDHSSAADVEPSRQFKALGFDSLAAVELRNRLTAATGVELTATAIFDYPSPAVLAEHLAGRFGGARPTGDTELAALESLLSTTDESDLPMITTRLRALLRKWDGAQEGDDLSEASADEVFRFLDRTLTENGPGR